MAGKKISQLASGSLSNLSLSGLTAVVHSGITYQHNLSNLRQILVDSGSHVFTGSQVINGNLTVSGSLTAHQYILSSSITNIVVQNISGSSVFGNDSSDKHRFTGSLSVTGSLDATIINAKEFLFVSGFAVIGDPIHHFGNDPEALHVGTTDSFNIAHFKGDNDYYSQVYIRNLNSGSNASTDLVVVADNGTENVHFVDLGINSSTYSGGLVGRENDAYLLNVGKDLYVGTVGGVNHPAKLYLFAENNWENPQITIHTGSQVTFNTSSFTSGYTYEFSGSAKFVDTIETTTLVGSNELNLLTEGSNVNILGSNLVVQNGGISTSFNLTSYGATINEIINIDSVTEKLVPYTSPNTGITHNFLSGSIAYISGATSDIIIDVVDVPTNNNKAIGLTVIIEQGSTAYKITGLKINSDDEGSVSISWFGSSQPDGTINATDIFAFSLLKVNNTWKVLGQKTTF